MQRRKPIQKSELKAQRKHQLQMAKIRLQQIRAQQEQAAYDQDPRFEKTGSREQFLTEPDQQHEANVAQAQQEAEFQTQEQPAHFTTPSRGKFLKNLLYRVALLNQQRGARPGNLRGLPPELADEARKAQNILNTPSNLVSDRPLISMRPEAGKISLMGSERTKPLPIKLSIWKSK